MNRYCHICGSICEASDYVCPHPNCDAVILGGVSRGLKILTENFIRKNNRWQSQCECHCGKLFITDKSKVMTGKRKSCGCARIDWFKNEGQQWNNAKKLNTEQQKAAGQKAVYKSYKQKCISNCICFELTLEEFSTYFDKPCFYCGRNNVNSYEGFRYNGIDRLNPKFGYTKDNIVSCCGPCNYSKLDYSPEEFIENCKRIVAHRCPGMINVDYKGESNVSGS